MKERTQDLEKEIIRLEETNKLLEDELDKERARGRGDRRRGALLSSGPSLRAGVPIPSSSS
jgi:hypothetical protein